MLYFVNLSKANKAADNSSLLAVEVWQFSQKGVHPIKYTHGFVVLCCVEVILLFVANPSGLFTHILYWAV